MSLAVAIHHFPPCVWERGGSAGVQLARSIAVSGTGRVKDPEVLKKN